MSIVEKTVSQTLSPIEKGILLIRDGIAGAPVRVILQNRVYKTGGGTLVASDSVTIGADNIRGLEYGTRIGIDAGAKQVGISGPSGATYSRSRVQVSAADVEATLVLGGRAYLTTFAYPSSGDLVIRLDGSAFSSPPSTVIATPAVSTEQSGTLTDVASLFESGQATNNITPGSVKFTLDLTTSGTVSYYDLAGDGWLYGPHGFGFINYRTTEWYLKLAETADSGAALTVALETSSDNATAAVTVQYSAYDNPDGA